MEEFRAGLAPDRLAAVDALRAIAATAGPELVETIKWNGPNYALDGEDRITLGLDRKGGVRAVLHRGAKTKETAGFSFDDPDGLASWPAPDRGVVTLAGTTEIAAQHDKLRDLFSRWLEANP